MTSTEPEQLTAGPHEAVFLISWNRTERQWLKGCWILKKQVPNNFENKTTANWKHKKSSCGPAAMSYK